MRVRPMIPNEDLNNIRAAQKAIIKLERGEPIMAGSEEHKHLTWAVVKLSGEVLTRTISDKELEKIRERIKQVGIW